MLGDMLLGVFWLAVCLFVSWDLGGFLVGRGAQGGPDRAGTTPHRASRAS
jgi:hypothetical protein